MRAIVIGAGPSGLAAAACLKKAGFTPEILDAGKKIGDSWRRHYDRLHLHTARGRSGLPGLPIFKGPRYPSRDEVVEYLQTYAEHFDLRPQFGCAVETVKPSNSGWRVTHAKGVSEAPVVVFATGLNGTPFVPEFTGLAEFGGNWVHSSSYKSAAPYAGKKVLVVGFGNTAGDVALDLAEAGVAVDMAVRGPVNLLPKELFGIPVTSLGILQDPPLQDCRCADRTDPLAQAWAERGLWPPLRPQRPKRPSDRGRPYSDDRRWRLGPDQEGQDWDQARPRALFQGHLPFRGRIIGGL